MQIILKGHRRCNLYVGGDRRDKSLQDIIEGTEHKEFFLKKSEDGTLEIWQATQFVPVIPETKKDPPIKEVFHKKKKLGSRT